MHQLSSAFSKRVFPDATLQTGSEKSRFGIDPDSLTLRQKVRESADPF
jgi:hypothetical protein